MAPIILRLSPKKLAAFPPGYNTPPAPKSAPLVLKIDGQKLASIINSPRRLRKSPRLANKITKPAAPMKKFSRSTKPIKTIHPATRNHFLSALVQPATCSSCKATLPNSAFLPTLSTTLVSQPLLKCCLRCRRMDSFHKVLRRRDRTWSSVVAELDARIAEIDAYARLLADNGVPLDGNYFESTRLALARSAERVMLGEERERKAEREKMEVMEVEDPEGGTEAMDESEDESGGESEIWVPERPRPLPPACGMVPLPLTIDPVSLGPMQAPLSAVRSTLFR